MEKLQATLTTDTFTRMKELVSFEIYNNLPRFDENEEFLFNQIGTDSKTNKDKYIEFYDFLKKKHNENTKFSFLQYDSLHTYYNLQKSYDLYNPMFKKNFDLEIYLYSFYTRDKDIYFNEFKALCNGRMRTLECQDVLTNQQDWSTIEINEAFVNDITTNERLMILLKYNPLFLGKCLYLSEPQFSFQFVFFIYVSFYFSSSLLNIFYIFSACASILFLRPWVIFTIIILIFVSFFFFIWQFG